MILKLNLTEKKLEQTEKMEDSWSKNFYGAKWAERHLVLMSLNKSSRDDLEQFCRKHWNLSAIRKHYVDRCLDEKKYDEAIGTLKESLILDFEYRGLQLSHSEKLKELFLMRGEKEQYLDQLWQQAVKYAPGNLEIYKELKEQYPRSEWTEIREELFALLPQRTGIDKFFREEGLLDRLIVYVVQSPGLYALKAHEDVLRKDYPNELLKKYREAVEAGASRTTSRLHYQELVSMLRSMKKIDGGNDIVNEIASHWRIAYRNRRAMMEELSKL